ncbi:hypothetical protein GWK36_09030 [Caldichromatium japonicum]|uniref:Uncharacterized protein n=1 Tax=Caldichromatium japonicum TaxID=2699430 RepID=A0A6G7VE14_9GAMM|nr:hypothetical protein [Caldichromatium japonicum]QIK38106.1 hypothetical protein GWK36_09030 [Caldichromatium japonicum]
MSLHLSAESQAFELPPSGSLPARCCHVIDLGTQAVEFQGETKRQHKIAIAWQLDERRSDGAPFTVSRRFTASLHEKAALRQFLEAWRGRPFTPEELKGFALPRLINAPCLLNIVHEERGGNTFAAIKSIAPMPRGMTPPPDVKDPLIFDLSDPNTWPAFERLSKRQQEAIEASPQWQERQAIGNPAASLADLEDDIAF